MISKQEFNGFLAQGYNRIPLVHEIKTDLETALSIYLKLADQPYTYLFESVKGGEKWGRYSFIGLPSDTIIRVKDHQLTVHKKDKLLEDIHLPDPLSWIADYQKQFRAAPIAHLPIFNGGLVGYFSYDTIRYIEPRLNKEHLPDPLNTPDILLMLSQEFIVFDTLLNKSYLIVYAVADQPHAYEHTVERIHWWLQQLKTATIASVHLNALKTNGTSEFQSNFSKEAYEAGVKKAIQYMVDGDAMQIAFSQRFSRAFHSHPFALYRALRSINPSPYLFYLNLKDFYIVGSSPEILVRLENDTVTLRPLAGTRPRGANLEQDLQLEKELLADPKELAEHLMLIDLGRNDLGRVSQIGSVSVTEKMVVERYSHVMHIVSNVTGKIKPDYSAMDLLRATFPAGTLTGTPKIRAMEIIDELENSKRGIYSGAVGYMAWNGNMDLAIAIRTAVIKDKTIYVQAGAGLVVDSIPENEWQETVNKAQAVLKAAQLVENGEDAA